MPAQIQILLIGSTGRTGSLVLAEALRRDHPVTVLIRKPNANIAESQPHSNLTTIIGDPCNSADVERALRATTPSIPVIIISTLGQTRTSGNPWAAATSPPRFMETSALAVLSACDAVKTSVSVRKVVLMSMFGAGESFARLNFLMRFVMKHSNMDVTLEDQNLVDRAVKAGKVPYVLVRAAMLSGGEVAPVRVYGNEGDGAGFMPKVSATSVAGFLLDAAENDQFEGMTPVIAN